MADDQNSSRLQQLVADLLALEHRIEEAFVEWLPGLQGHTVAVQIIRPFQAMVKGQGDALEACLRRISGSESGSTGSAAPFDMPPVPHKGGPHAGSNALHAMT